MDASFSDSSFSDFGVDPLYPFSRTGLCSVEAADTDKLRQQVRQFVPRLPGVYGMVDALDRLIYVGKSKALRNRLLSYFLPNNEEDKAGRIVQSTRRIVWETQPSEFAALLREQSLIRNFQPRFNVQGIPKRQQPIYVCLGRQPAEQFYTARRSDPAATSLLGPLFGASRAGRAVEVLNRVFRLRDCSSKQPCSFTDQLQLFDIELRPGCIRLEIQSCLGPCISGCSRSEYEVEVARARAFLAGEDHSPIEELEQAMFQAAENHHFEQAARIREDLRAVKWLSHRAADVATARDRYTFIYPVPDSAGDPKRTIWYLIRRGMIEGSLAAPIDPRQREETESILRSWWQAQDTIGTPFTPRSETLALIASWFRNQRAEIKRTFLLTKQGKIPTKCLQTASVKVSSS